MKKRNYILQVRVILSLLITACTLSCQKVDDWLDVKRNKKDIIPSTLEDFQAMMDNDILINRSYMMLGSVCTDNLYVTEANLSGANIWERNAYSFAKDIFEGANPNDFATPYTQIAYANAALEGLEKISPEPLEQAVYNNIRGQALFLRAYAYYHLSQSYCKPYTASTAGTDLGLQLKLSTNPNVSVPRSTIQQTYDLMLADVREAIDLLPVTAKYTTRPSSVAANALMAKIYLSMENYTQAGLYADAVLTDYDTLLDFNSDLIQPNSTYRFPAYTNSGGNPEIIFYASNQTYSMLSPSESGRGYVDSNLYASYVPNDMRKTLFYQEIVSGTGKFVGGYTGSFYNFGGIATNELFLIRAECLARQGNVAAAMADLNRLLEHRFLGSYVPLTATNAEEALSIVLTERRKELPFTGQLRWEDLRRLNKDPRFAKTVVHVINGVPHELPPNDPRYVLPIPDLEIELSGIPQNQR